MEIFVLGMHRSGTSMTTRLLDLCGIHFGPVSKSIGQNNQNPKGFWERRDVRNVNDHILHSLGFDWDRVFGAYSRVQDSVENEAYLSECRRVIQEMKQHEPWLLKEPRFCITFPIWKKCLSNPVIVYVSRHPVETAISLRKRNSIPLSSGVAMWEYYNRCALDSIQGMKVSFVNYHELLSHPIETLERLIRELKSFGVDDINLASRDDIFGFIDPSLNRSKSSSLYLPLPKEVDDFWEYCQHLRSGVYRDKTVQAISTFSAEELAVYQDFTKWEVLFDQVEERLKRLTQKMRMMHSHKHARNDLGCSPSELPRVIAPSFAHLKVDIVVCVYNALEDVQVCLNSLIKNRVFQFRIILVDDASDSLTKNFLDEFCEQFDFVELITHEDQLGYTVSANEGIRASCADYTLLLNSDTIVSEHWIERMLECAQSDSSIGIVGPISNAASYQSIPFTQNSDGTWVVNNIPKGMSVDSFAKQIATTSLRIYPRVPVLNGFCFCVNRKVFEEIGLLDEVAFPMGYGEENDFCFRACQAGFQLAVADHAYVYHAKSKSFKFEGRNVLNEAGNQALIQKWGLDYLQKINHELSNQPVLANIRSRSAELYGNDQASSGFFRSTSILFILPSAGGSGGAHSVIQECQGLRHINVNATVAIPYEYREGILDLYSDFDVSLFRFYQSFDELISIANDHQMIVATYYASVKDVMLICERNKELVPAYYIQDYEPYFFDQESEEYQEAYDSYSLIDDCVFFAKTDWICEKIYDEHQIRVHKIAPSLDHSVFYSDMDNFRDDQKFNICAMIRPNTPRRNASLTLDVLNILSYELSDRCNFFIFGCSDQDLEKYSLVSSEQVKNMGKLKRVEVANLYRYSDLFLDLSEYQAFGRSGIEAMACGCAVVLPAKGGVYEYASHEWNSLIVDTENAEVIKESINRVIYDCEFCKKLKVNALETVRLFSVDRAVLSIKALFNRYI